MSKGSDFASRSFDIFRWDYCVITCESEFVQDEQGRCCFKLQAHMLIALTDVMGVVYKAVKYFYATGVRVFSPNGFSLTVTHILSLKVIAMNVQDSSVDTSC